jgi:hypothetical protein
MCRRDVGDGTNVQQRQTIARVAFRQPAMIRTFITPTAVRQGIHQIILAEESWVSDSDY